MKITLIKGPAYAIYRLRLRRPVQDRVVARVGASASAACRLSLLEWRKHCVATKPGDWVFASRRSQGRKPHTATRSVIANL
jgi:hypothetical protein